MIERLRGKAAAALMSSIVPAFLVCGSACANARQYDIAPAPGWVEPLSGIGSLPENATGGSVYMLVDRQIRVARGWSEYRRYVTRVVNAAGMEDASQLSIDFDPKLDHLQINAVTVRRGAQVLNELKQSRIEILRRESGLDDGIVDGTLTFHLLMSDVRVGDDIDVSYTVEHHAPAWNDRFFERITTRWGVPVGRSRLRVILPEGAPLFISGTEPRAPARHREGSWRVLQWDWNDLPAVTDDDDAPSWYQQYPAIQFSQFADWHELVTATLPLFAFDAHDREVAAVAQRLKSGATTASDRALAAVRFVQEEIRYTGLELGSGAYRPRLPSEVLRSRYGDCKDKALLAVALLRAMGIDAAPALVSTRWQNHLHEQLPSPGDFDHAVVRMRLAGETYWIDATETGQGGDLQTLDQAYFGDALVISPGVSKLQRMPRDIPAQPLVAATAVFDLHGGLDAEGSYTIATVYRGSEADHLRRRLRRTSAAELGKGYLDYYQRRYPGVTAVSSPAIHDDPVADEITVNEAYRIPHPFESLSGGKRRFELESEVIDDYVQRPSQSDRKAPLALDYPAYVTEQITIRLPSFFPVKDGVVDIDPAAFHYQSRLTHEGNDVVFQTRYRALADEVPPDQLPDFLKRVDDVRQDDSMYFTSSDRAPDEKAAATAGEQLANAMSLARNGHNDDADAAFTKLLASSDFDALTAAQRHAALLVAGAVATEKSAFARALDLLVRACGMEQADATDWKMRVYAAQGAGNETDAGFALTTLARRWPDDVRAMDFRTIGRVLHDLPEAGTSRYDLLSALQQARYAPQDFDPSLWWRDLTLLQLERGESDKARATASAIKAPYAVISVLADARFAGVRTQAHLPDVSAAIQQEIGTLQAAVAKSPNELEPIIQLSYRLLYSLRFADALRLEDSVIAAVSGPKGPKAYKDYGTNYVWILDLRSQALYGLGRWDEAADELLTASHLPENGADNVSQVINLAQLYDDLGQPRKARAALSGLRPEMMSPYGHTQVAIALLASADQLGDRTEVERQLAYIRDHRADSQATYEQALISANRPDDAARLLISRLQDPSERIDALMEVQTYREYPLPPRAREIQQRWRALVRRRDVRAAIDRVGNIGSYPLTREGS